VSFWRCPALAERVQNLSMKINFDSGQPACRIGRAGMTIQYF